MKEITNNKQYQSAITINNRFTVTYAEERLKKVIQELHDWRNKGHGMCYPVCWMMHIKEPSLLIGKSSPCGSSGFPLSG